jgi:hypothetical protein
MELRQVILAQVAKFVQVVTPKGGTYWPDIVRAAQARYGFIKVPDRIDEFDQVKGVSFYHGKFISKEGPILLTQFQYFSNGMLVQTVANSKQADEFLEDVLSWIGEELKFTIQGIGSFPTRYASELEILLDADIGAQQSMALKIAARINQALIGYGESVKIRPTGFVLSFDPKELAVSGFTLDRRAGASFSEKIYWSRAPLRTDDHLEVLRLVEQTYLKHGNTP